MSLHGYLPLELRPVEVGLLLFLIFVLHKSLHLGFFFTLDFAKLDLIAT